MPYHLSPFYCNFFLTTTGLERVTSLVKKVIKGDGYLQVVKNMKKAISNKMAIFFSLVCAKHK